MLGGGNDIPVISPPLILYLYSIQVTDRNNQGNCLYKSKQIWFYIQLIFQSFDSTRAQDNIHEC